MSDGTFSAARRLIGEISEGLQGSAAEGVEEALSRLAKQDISQAAYRPPVPLQKPVARYLSTAISAVAPWNAPLSRALAAIAEQLRWLQSASYTDAILGEGFSQNYAWCELIGAEGFFRGDDYNLGVLLLGPNRHYLDHYHPAPELYWPLTAPSDWKKGDGPFVPRAQGEIIWHPSMTIHATKTFSEPLLAVFAWTRDAAIGARLCALDS